LATDLSSIHWFNNLIAEVVLFHLKRFD